MSRGFSTIVGPEGDVLAGPLTESEGILYAEIDPGRARASRRQFDAVGHYARPDVFHLQVDTRPKPAVTFSGSAASATEDQPGAPTNDGRLRGLEHGSNSPLKEGG
jgi:nitrilase